MSERKDLQKFGEDFFQEIISRAEVEDMEEYRENIFVELMIEYLEESEEIDGGIPCYHKKRGIQVNGYQFYEDHNTLDLFISIFQANNELETVTKTDINSVFSRLNNFLDRSLEGYHAELEESSDVFDLSIGIFNLRKSLQSVRMILLTNGLVKPFGLDNNTIKSINISYHMWDLERLYRLVSSGKQREVIDIELSDFGEDPVPCIIQEDFDREYKACITVFPATLLYKIYEMYGSRLLEKNIRSFLQVRGNVNKDILNTIQNEPNMFLAYNNGISVTAESIRFDNGSNINISGIKDFQIVNGGQTTASLYNAVKKKNADISNIYIQAKITIVNNVEKMDEMVPMISRCANSQNKIQIADFSANHPFHRSIEELSRTIWAPTKEGNQRQTRWFYERSRGQYADIKSREHTRTGRKIFDATHPLKQKFTKTDLAKYEGTWEQLPHVVSLGAQKNFKNFMFRLKERGKFTPDQKYFEHLVAKAIIFRSTEKLVSAQKYGGYRANIVAYTVAWLSHKTAQRIDLDAIWKKQEISSILQEAIVIVSKYAFEHICRTAGNANVTEWCKKILCWQRFKEVEINLPAEFYKELLNRNKAFGQTANKGISAPDKDEDEIIKFITSVPPETWYEISSWAKQTDNLESWQRGLAFSLGKRAKYKNNPSFKQARQGVRILVEANLVGFLIPEEIKNDLKLYAKKLKKY